MLSMLDGAFWHVANVAETFANVDPRLLALAALLHVTNHLLRSLAWRNILAAAYPENRVTFVGVTAAYATGVALNAVVPARGGDAAKLGLARAEIRGSSLTTIGSTIAVMAPFDLVIGAMTILLVGVTGTAPITLDVASMASYAEWLTDHALLAAGLAGVVAALGWFLVRRVHCRMRCFIHRVRQGGAIFRTPRRYLSHVALMQAIAFGCRIGVVMSLLAAFGLPASPLVAAFVMVVAGMSTIVPLTPGGAGTQQVMLTYALSQAASGAAVVSFSIGMQAGVTAVNALLGLGAAMVACRSLRGFSTMRSRLRAVEG
ncbi:MAG TPA: lysylphosphatidylglycerol synthase transmembrane domain-containing protein [Nocardioidaceae bacterium]|nr:lysylphosphatidylglycerol synthase transmembrane domain-containing protein [Nocardioidaceae bacterium]